MIHDILSPFKLHFNHEIMAVISNNYTIFFDGCINKCDIAMHYYYECCEYYNMIGISHKKCSKKSIIDWCGQSPGKRMSV